MRSMKTDIYIYYIPSDDVCYLSRMDLLKDYDITVYQFNVMVKTGYIKKLRLKRSNKNDR